MIFRKAVFFAIISLWLVMLVGCTDSNSEGDTTPDTNTEMLSTPTQISVQPTPVELTEPVQESLVIWWPDEIAPSDNDEINALLSQQFAEFASTQENLTIDFRLKRAQDVGGILSTLRTASSVAPTALPDITLLRYNALLVASAPQNRLIQSMEGLVPASITSNLNPSVLALGQVMSDESNGGELYGLPYLLDPVVMAYHEDSGMMQGDEWSFSNLLEAQQSFAFPASRTNSLNEILYLQYLSAAPDGIQTNFDIINEVALLDVFQFYEDAMANGMIDASILNYLASSDYQTLLLQGDISAGTVDLTGLRRLQTQSDSIEVGLIPTYDGTPYTLLNGWVWVIVTSDAERRSNAQNFINWMMDSERQSAYAQAVGLLPSQNSALQQWNDLGNFSVSTINTMLTNSILATNPETQAELQSHNARAIQTAFVAMINGEMNAVEAVQQILETTAN